jgi:hypothetical protein
MRKLSTGEPCAGEPLARFCVQRRLACSTGVSPVGVIVKASSLDSRVAGNQDLEAYRLVFPWEMRESAGRNESKRKSGLENE